MQFLTNAVRPSIASTGCVGSPLSEGQTAQSGEARPGDRSVFSGEISAREVTASDFSLQLPDAMMDGTLYRFPLIHFSGRPFHYFEDACLR